LELEEAEDHYVQFYSEKSDKMQQCIKILFLILNEAQHDSGDAPPIIWSLKLYKQPLVQLLDVVQQLHVRQPSTHAKPDAACAVLGS
jgi:hypothetical protein